MAPAGRQGIVQRSPHTALGCTRPFKIKPALLSASHNPQGGDDLDCPVKSVWSLLFLPKPCECRGQWHRTGKAAWSTRGPMSEPRTPPKLSQYSERSSCLVRSKRNNSNNHVSLDLWFRLRAAAMSRHAVEQLGRQQADLFRVCERMCECVRACTSNFSSCQILLDYWNFQLNYTPSA